MMIVLLFIFLLNVNVMPEHIPEGLIFTGKNQQGYAEFMDKKDSTLYVYIPEGEFTMGNEDKFDDGNEHPYHKVYLDGYFISKYEITNRQYKKFCDQTGYKYPKEPHFKNMYGYFINYPNYPAVNISYNDAKAYCKWVNADLPTEAQWEKAARGTDKRRYPWGNHSPFYKDMYYANYEPGGYDPDGYYYTCPVNAFSNGVSPYGIYNMAGNVWEWCKDFYLERFYSESPYKNPICLKNDNDKRVIRGGSFYYFAWDMRTTKRFAVPPNYTWDAMGFRIVKKEK